MPDSASLAYEIWDVFTTERFKGNPLAVFPQAGLLTDTQMSDLAREMAHSESTFVIRRPESVEKNAGVRVRIFAKDGSEMPFAGHPTLGTAFALLLRQTQSSHVERTSILLDENIGPVPVQFRREGKTWYGEMLQPDPVFAESHKPQDLASVLGVAREAIVDSLPLQNVSTGRPNIIVVLRNRNALRSAAVDWRAAAAYFASGDRQRGFYLLTEEEGKWFARKPGRTGDDPVTGSAGGCAAAYLVRHGLLPSGSRLVLHQGEEVNRPGQMLVSARQAEGGRISNVTVAGSAVLAARGTIA